MISGDVQFDSRPHSFRVRFLKCHQARGPGGNRPLPTTVLSLAAAHSLIRLERRDARILFVNRKFRLRLEREHAPQSPVMRWRESGRWWATSFA